MQIVGASATAAAAVGMLFGSGIGVANTLIFGSMLLFCAVTILAGIWVWNAELRGFRLAAFSLAFQIPVLQSSLLSYKFSFGIGMTLFLAGEPGKFRYDLGGFGQLTLFGGQLPLLVGVNLVAIAALAWVLRRQHRMESEPGQTAPVTSSVNPPAEGALIYAADPKSLGTFYARTLGLSVSHETPSHVILSGNQLQLTIVEQPVVASTQPGERRVSAVALYFCVDSLDRAQAIIEQHGGRVLPERWPGPMFTTAKFVDPDGNLQHLREFHAPDGTAP